MMNTFNNLHVVILLLLIIGVIVGSVAEDPEQDDGGSSTGFSLKNIAGSCFIFAIWALLDYLCDPPKQQQEEGERERTRSSSDVSNRFVRQNRIAPRMDQEQERSENNGLVMEEENVYPRSGPRLDQDQRQLSNGRPSMEEEIASPRLNQDQGQVNNSRPSMEEEIAPRLDQAQRQVSNGRPSMEEEIASPRLDQGQGQVNNSRPSMEEEIAPRLDQDHQGQENNGLTDEEENANRRFERFVTKFYFQTVSADKSNISAESIRKSNKRKDEETPSDNSNASFDDSSDVASQSLSKRNMILGQFGSWMSSSSAEKECCICLGNYCEGESICAPATTSCNHVFHESCIQEWLKEKDQCPLCRVDLLKD